MMRLFNEFKIEKVTILSKYTPLGSLAKKSTTVRELQCQTGHVWLVIS
jgi:hypothetical protein